MLPSWVRWTLATAAMLFVLDISARGDNPTQRENGKPGDRSWRSSNLAKNGEIEGYASEVSINRGESITFYINTAAPRYTLEIFRMGWYGGAGARKMLSPVTLPGVQQPIPSADLATGLIECQWAPSFVLQVPNDSSDPTNWMSGIYIARLTALDTQKQSYVLFVVRDDSRPSDFLFQNSVATYQAYNSWGGMSLYTTPQAHKVSFNRPMRKGEGLADFALWGWEIHMLRFLEQEGYDVTYTTDLDTHSRGNLLLTHKAFLVVGHDEYWSWQMRDNVEAARDYGVSLGFFGANIAYWQVRFEPSVATGAPNRTMVCYKSASLDPITQTGNPADQRLATTKFRLPPVNRPEDALIGVMYETGNIEGDMVVVNSNHWIWEGTGLLNGDHLRGMQGYEADRIFGHAPPWIQRVAHSPYAAKGWDGCSVSSLMGCEIRYADMTVYDVESGATVVATGTMHWTWGLDKVAPNPLATPIAAVRQATRNILARFRNPPPYFLEPRSLTFPAQLLGTVSPKQEIVIVNHRDISLTVREATGSNDFKYDSACQGVISAGQKCLIGVTFAPSVAGASAGNLGIYLSGDPTTPIQVPFAGTGVTFGISPASGFSNTATVNAGRVAQYQLDLNSSGFSGSVAALTCKGLPAHLKCHVDPSTISLTGNMSSSIKVTVDTSNELATPMRTTHEIPLPRMSVPFENLIFICLLALLSLTCAVVMRHRVRLVFASSIFLAFQCTACSGMPQMVSYHLAVDATAEGITSSISLELRVRLRDMPSALTVVPSIDKP